MCAVGIDRGRIAQLCEAAIEALVAVPVIFSSQLSPSNAVARFAARPGAAGDGVVMSWERREQDCSP
jgi:hypothetical protein